MTGVATVGVFVTSIPSVAVPLSVAVTCTVTGLVTLEVVTVNVPCVCPAATVTDDGAVMGPVLAVSGTETPPAGAAVLIVTVPVTLLPPTTGFGWKTRFVM
jgi:hypothetical protein